jgi:hypothetical protein
MPGRQALPGEGRSGQRNLLILPDPLSGMAVAVRSASAVPGVRLPATAQPRREGVTAMSISAVSSDPCSWYPTQSATGTNQSAATAGSTATTQTGSAKTATGTSTGTTGTALLQQFSADLQSLLLRMQSGAGQIGQTDPSQLVSGSQAAATTGAATGSTSTAATGIGTTTDTASSTSQAASGTQTHHHDHHHGGGSAASLEVGANSLASDVAGTLEDSAGTQSASGTTSSSSVQSVADQFAADFSSALQANLAASGV